MTDEENEDIQMAECGSCRTIIPLESESCPNCGVRFGEISDEHLGECGACGKLQSPDSTSCDGCGVSFVAIDESIQIDEGVDSSEIEVDEVDETTSESEDDVDTAKDAVSEPEEVASDAILEDSPAEVEEQTDTQIEAEEQTDTQIEVDDDVAESDDEVVAEESEEPEDEADTDETTESSEDDLEEDGSEDEDSAEKDDEEEEESAEEDDEDEDESAEEDDEDEDESAEEEVVEVDTTAVIMAFESLALAIAGSGMTAAEAFSAMDTSEDNLIDAPELQKGIENIGGEKLAPSEVKAILNYLDGNENNRIDPMELVKALDNLKIGIKPGVLPKQKKVKEFPSNIQKFLMGKKANDIFYPVMYFLLVSFIGLWVVNGIGLIVDGTGGTITYDGHNDGTEDLTFANWDICENEKLVDNGNVPDPCNGSVVVGETYPCDPAIDPDKCQNSITPFSGENGGTSMPAGFYTDGIMMIILGVIGLGATAYLHLAYAPNLRKRAKGDSDVSEEETMDDVDSDEEEEQDHEEDDDSDDDDDSDVDADDDSDDDEDDDSDDDDDEDEDGGDDIDVGSWVGIDVDGEEFYGEIIEFDDDEGTVTIETEDGDEVTGDQEDMFVDDE